jgi:hypothetical protein
LCDGIGDDDEDICWIWRAILPLSSPSSELDDLYSRDVGDGLPLCRGGGILPFRNAFDEDDMQTVAMILQVGMVVFISVFGLLLLSMNTLTGGRVVGIHPHWTRARMSWEEGRVLLAQANVVVRLFVCCSFVVFSQIPHLTTLLVWHHSSSLFIAFLPAS